MKPCLPVTSSILFVLVLGGVSLRADEPIAPGDLAPAALAVDALPNGPSSNGNRVLEPGETVVVAPAWRNTTSATIAATSVASDFVGPGLTGLYTLTDPSASYVVPPGQTVSCTAGGDCFALSVGVPATRPEAHWDATLGETTSVGSAKTWMVHVGDSYPDVPRTSVFYRYVETLLHHGVTGGCPTAGSFCPLAPMTREWMAPFVLGSLEGRYYLPKACTRGQGPFADMPATNPLCRWVEELARRGVVAGCGGGNYCPGSAVSREQMAVFILATREGPAYVPPPCVAGSERFADVPASSPFCRWIEELARRNVVTGCGNNNYCPSPPVTRQEMSVFLSVTFGLALYGAPPHMYLVNTTDDVNDGACAPGHCSLREAMLAANQTPNPGAREEVRFRVPGIGPHILDPTSPLPPITEAVVIDGYSQPGARPNTLGFGSGLDADLRIELNLSGTTLLFATSNALVRGLALNRSPQAAITISGADNAVEGCFIGTNASGSVALANRFGIYINEQRHQNRIGGTLPSQRNLISGSTDGGVVVESSFQNLIQGNLIGLDRSGMTAIPNWNGVLVTAPWHATVAANNVVGGTEEGAGNVISGNTTYGVGVSALYGASVSEVNNTLIQANIIGRTADNASPLPNPTGVSVGNGRNTWVGGNSVAPAGNSITATDAAVNLGGIYGTHVQGNRIQGSQVGIRSSSGLFGPSDAIGNVIGPNSAAGVLVTGGILSVKQNSIQGHGGLGIDLGPAGVTPNDPGDADGLQNFPVLQSAASSGGAVTVTGTLNSRPSASFLVEFFSSPAAHPSGHGEGATFIGSVGVSTNAAGTAPIAATLPVAVTPGRVVTATATGPSGNTSEFSAAVTVTP